VKYIYKTPFEEHIGINYYSTTVCNTYLAVHDDDDDDTC